MAYFCYKCSGELALGSSGSSNVNSSIGRSDTCPKCMADIRVCKNCAHYEPGVYNECRESQADRVVDKEKGNFCDHFSIATDRKSGSNQKASDPFSALDDLFKK